MKEQLTNPEAPRPARLDYWRAKADLCRKLMMEQMPDPDKQVQAVTNLKRYVHAKNMEAVLQPGQNMSWLLPEGNDAA